MRVTPVCSSNFAGRWTHSRAHWSKVAVSRQNIGDECLKCREPLQRFFVVFFRKRKNKSPLAEHFSDKARGSENSLICATYSFCSMNVANQIAAFKAKLELLGRRVNGGMEEFLTRFKHCRGFWKRLSPIHHSPSWCTISCLCFWKCSSANTSRPHPKEWTRVPFVQTAPVASVLDWNHGRISWDRPKKALKTLLPFPTSILGRTFCGGRDLNETRLDARCTSGVTASHYPRDGTRPVAEKQAQGSH